MDHQNIQNSTPSPPPASSEGMGANPPTHLMGKLPSSKRDDESPAPPLSRDRPVSAELIHWLSSLLKTEEGHKGRFTAIQRRAEEYARQLILHQLDRTIRRGLSGWKVCEDPQRWYLSPGTVAAMSETLSDQEQLTAWVADMEEHEDKRVGMVAVFPEGTSVIDMPYTERLIAILQKEEPAPNKVELEHSWSYLHAPNGTVEAVFIEDLPY